MKRHTLLLVSVWISLTTMAIPVSPRLIDSLAAKGETTRIEQLHRSERAIAERTARERAMGMRKAPANTEAPSIRNIASRGVVVLIEFQDREFLTDRAELDSMLSGKNYTRSYKHKGRPISSSGSAWRYFYDQSMGQYSPEFKIVGPVKVSHEMSYYGGNDYWGNDKRAADMMVEACRMIEDSIDFKDYDNDGDGAVDFVYAIYAGYGEADSGIDTTIWPHSSDLSYKYTLVDNVRLGSYACSNELLAGTKAHAGIGTFCHEFSHVLGLPDLYITSGAYTHKTMGEWDILDQGPYNNDGNTPPNYSAYERWFMGWLTPTLPPEKASVKLGAIDQINQAMMLTSTGKSNLDGLNPNPTTFYMLECRIKRGWDKYLPGEGMLVTKVRYSRNSWMSNTVNNSASNMGVDIVEADGKTSTQYGAGKAEDAYPAGGTEMLKLSEYQITNIDANLDECHVTYDVNGGGAEIDLTLDVEDTRAEVNTADKVMRDGMVYIVRNGRVYDVLGKKIEN